MKMDISTAKFVYHHVVLPPKLPQGDDADPEHEAALLHLVLDSLELFPANWGSGTQDAIRTVSNMIRNGIAVRDDRGTINEPQLATEQFGAQRNRHQY